MDPELENRFIKLESIVSCQDQMLADLNSVVISQDKIIQELQKELRELKQTLSSLAEEPDNRPPPHY